MYPPLWYYTSVPADLTHTGAFLRAKGLDVTLLDLSAKLSQDLLGHVPAFAALQDPATYADPATRDVGMAQIKAACKRISQQHRVPYSVRALSFPEIDAASVHSARRIGLDPARNPALPTLTDAAVKEMLGYNWPGNVREMRNVITRAVVMSGPLINADSLVFNPWSFEPEPEPQQQKSYELDPDAIRAALARNGNNRSRTARELGIPRSSLLYRIRKYNLG